MTKQQETVFLEQAFQKLKERGWFADQELERSINAFLHALPERDCNVFLRRYWYAEPLQDIARRYGLKENTVKTSLYRTRQKLKLHLEKEGILL